MPHPDEQDLEGSADTTAPLSLDQVDDDEEEDGDDMDYNPEDDEDDEDDDDDDDDNDDDDDDASQDNEMADGLVQVDGGQDEPPPSAPPERMLALLRTLLDAGHVGNVLANYGDTNDVLAFLHGRQPRRTPRDPGRFPKVPSEEGILLMQSGLFGVKDDAGWGPRDSCRRLIDRELGIGGLAARVRNERLMKQKMIPTSRAESIIHYDNPVYGGQFSDDGSFFYSFCKDFKVRMYDTRNPFNWSHYKTTAYPWPSWTLTDASLSPDNKWLAYTSLTSLVCLAPTDPNDRGDPYNLELGNPRCGLFSVRFSGDGRELIAGSNANSIIIFDIESRTALHHVRGHDDDVNAVCFADKGSPHIIYSGSDDCIIKVWDRRSMGENRPAGAFVGHREGITYIDSKGDGRYVLSNGKDQSMKLWDLRKATSADKITRTPRTHLRQFDYRMGRYDENSWDPHPDDNSTVTFRGHKVLRTLIRCHFSPPSSTDSHYVYSGSQDGKVYIWNMDATLAGVVDVRSATINQRTSAPENAETHFTMLDDPDDWSTCVRDVSWHPTASVLVASAWNGPGLSVGTCSIHSFDELGEDQDEEGEAVSDMGKNVTETLEPLAQSANQ